MIEDEDKTVAAANPFQQQGGGGEIMSAPKASLVCTDTSQIEGAEAEIRIDLGVGEVIVGRDPDCTMPINSRKLSRRHARIFPGTGMWGVEDRHSTNGVFVNGRRVTSAWLHHGDEVRFGPIAFQFSLDRPDLAPAQDAAPADQGGGDDEGERTMMFGSRAASEAVLQSIRTTDPEALVRTTATETVASRHQQKQAARTPAAASKAKRMALIGVPLLLAVAGIGFFLTSGEPKAIGAAVSGNSALAGKVIANVRERTGSDLLNASYDADVAALTERLAGLTDLASKNPGHAGLVSTGAELAFLRFERQFVPMLRDGRLDEAAALIATTKGQVERLLAGGSPSAEMEHLHSARQLLDLAEIVERFRRFSTIHPKPAEGVTPPAVAEVMALGTLKARFAELRRSQNKALSVYYVVFRSLVDQVEERDIALINAWSSRLTGG